MTPERIYIAGPMTGHPKFNFPLFDAVAEELRDLDFEVVSPSELDDEKSRAAAMASEWGDPEEYAALTGLTWADFLSRDVKLIADGGFAMIVCLPGWQQSRGARLETFVGALCGITIYEYNDGTISAVTALDRTVAWTGLNIANLKVLIAEREVLR